MTGTTIAKEERLIVIEDFLKYHWFQKASRMVQFGWTRDPTHENRLAITSWFCFYKSAVVNSMFYGMNIIGIIVTTYLGQPSNQNPAVLSISSYCAIRGTCLFLKRHDILRFLNVLDRELPKNLTEQRELQLFEVYENYRKRNLFVNTYAHVSLVYFFCLPLGFYFFTNEGHGDMITLDQQLLGGWLPFQLRQNHNIYLLIWFYDMVCAVCGISFFTTFDTIFNAMQSHLIMHSDALTRELKAIDARESLQLGENYNFYAKIYRLAARQQRLNIFCSMYNDIFRGAILIGNFVVSAAICLHLYICTETSDFITIVKYLFPTLGLIGFTFDLCKCGTQLEDASERLQMTLYNQNWYMGSRKYRKLMLLWLQNAQNTQKLAVFGSIQVNMEHFTDIMQLAYKLFTFLKSR